MIFPFGKVDWHYLMTSEYVFKLFDLLDKNGVHAVIEDLMNIPKRVI